MLHPTVDGGYGLVGMRERVDALGGTFDGRSRGRRPVDGACRDSRSSGPSAMTPRRIARPPITVLLADDQAMVRAGFRMIIDSQPDMTVVGEVDNGRAAVDLAQRIRPDVCLLDIRMPVLDGLAATRLLAGPDVQRPLRVVIATTFDSDEHVEIALRNGAVGFILKDSGPQLLLEAVRAAAVGDALISPSITVRYLDRFVEPSSVRAAAADTRCPNESSTSPAPLPAGSATRRSRPSCSSRCPPSRPT